MKDTKALGQYFTPAYVADFMLSLSDKGKNSKVLEPSAGEGVFLSSLEKKGFQNIFAYDIDDTLENKSNIPIVHESFINQELEGFDLVIGNPPYIRWKNIPQHMKEELLSNSLWNQYFNSLCDYLYIFILKSIEVLKEGGELIFITPEYWMHTTHSLTLRNYMLEHGYFEKIFHFKETPIFDKVASSIIIFKFIKASNKTQRKIFYTEYNSRQKLSYEVLSMINLKEEIEGCEYIELEQFEKNTKWVFADKETISFLNKYENACKIKGQDSSLFADPTVQLCRLGDIARIGNGMVTGLDKAFQLPNEIELNSLELKSTIEVSKAKHLEAYKINDTIRYIFINEKIDEKKFPDEYPNFFEHLQPFKEKLLKRYSYNREIPYWEWVFLRNYENLCSRKSKKIFVPCKERISHKSHIRFALSSENIFPTQDVTGIYLNNDIQESIYYVLALLNSTYIFEWLKYNGIIKGNILEFSEKPTSQIPIKLINWNDPCEVSCHDKITSLTQEYLASPSLDVLNKINIQIETLLDC